MALDTFFEAGALAPGPQASDWPAFGVADDVRPALAEILAQREPGALATLVRVDGPSPRPVGSQMAIAADGRASGHVSGGCVEGSVAIVGREVAESGKPRLVVFGRGSPFVDVQLICGARIEVFIERASADDATLHAVLQARAARRSIVRSVTYEGEASTRAATDADALAGADDETRTMFRRYDPPTRLVVLGHDPVALALASLANAAGIESVIARAKGPPSGPANGARYLSMAPVEAFDTLKLDRWTAIVTTTHDLNDDHEALEAALPSDAFYVGALGSRLRVADRVAKLEKAGVAWDAIKRLRAPVGMDIGAATPMEIALSILADIVRVQRKGA